VPLNPEISAIHVLDRVRVRVVCDPVVSPKFSRIAISRAGFSCEIRKIFLLEISAHSFFSKQKSPHLVPWSSPAFSKRLIWHSLLFHFPNKNRLYPPSSPATFPACAPRVIILLPNANFLAALPACFPEAVSNTAGAWSNW
jgi:hypothetical protein